MLTQITNMLGLPQPAQTKDTAAPSDEGADFGEVFVEGDQNSVPTEPETTTQDVEVSTETSSEEEEGTGGEETGMATDDPVPTQDPDPAPLPTALGEASKDVPANRSQDLLGAQNRVEPVRTRRMQNMVEAARAMQKRIDAADASKQPVSIPAQQPVPGGAVVETSASVPPSQNRKAKPSLPIFEQKQLGAFVPEKVPALVRKVQRVTPAQVASAQPDEAQGQMTPVANKKASKSPEPAVGRSALLAMAQAQASTIQTSTMPTRATPTQSVQPTRPLAEHSATSTGARVVTVETHNIAPAPETVHVTTKTPQTPEAEQRTQAQQDVTVTPRFSEGEVAVWSRSTPENTVTSLGQAKAEPQPVVSVDSVRGRDSIQAIRPETVSQVSAQSAAAAVDELADLDAMLARMPQPAQVTVSEPIEATPPSVLQPSVTLAAVASPAAMSTASPVSIPSTPLDPMPVPPSQPAVMAQVTVPTPPPAAPTPAIETPQLDVEPEAEPEPTVPAKQGFVPTDMQVRVRTSAAAQKIDIRDMQPGGDFFRNANVSGPSFMEQQTEAELSEVSFTNSTAESRVQSGSYTAQAVQMARAETAAVVRQIADQIPRLSQTGTVEIALSPEELGSVRMQMVQGESGLTVLVQAERPETLDLMRRNIDQLAQDLADAGYENTAFEFADDQGSDQGAGQGGQGSGDPSSAEAQTATPMSVNPAAMNDGLDIRV